MGAEDFQEVREPVAMEGMPLDPTFPKRMLVSNILRRCVLWGFSESVERFLSLKASADGELLVANADELTALEAIQAAVEGELDVADTDAQVILGAIQDAVEATLVVSADAQIPDGLDIYAGDAADAYSVYQAFDGITKGVTILANDFGLDIMFKDPSEVAQDALWVPADTGIALALKVHSFRLKNHTGGSNCAYQVVGSLLG